MEISSKHFHSQTVRARQLKFWAKVHHPPPVMCHISHVTCHVSYVMCHMSCVTCHMSHVTCNVSHITCHMLRATYHHFYFLQNGGASRRRVCYKSGLPCLVFVDSKSWRASKLQYWFKSYGDLCWIGVRITPHFGTAEIVTWLRRVPRFQLEMDKLLESSKSLSLNLQALSSNLGLV